MCDPRFGLLGMLAGWWRVVVSSGCPLQPEGCFASIDDAHGRGRGRAGSHGLRRRRRREDLGRRRRAQRAGARRPRRRPPPRRNTEPAPGAETEPDQDAALDTAEPGVPQGSPGRGCLRGSYLSLRSWASAASTRPSERWTYPGAAAAWGSTFTRTRWVMRGVGSKPMRGKALGIDGTLKVNGSARGRLIRAEGERIRFRQTGSGAPSSSAVSARPSSYRCRWWLPPSCRTGGLRSRAAGRA